MADKPENLTPKLRFPEFRDGPGWDAVNGNELFDLIDRRPAPPGLPILAITQEHGAVPRDYIDYHVSVSETSIASYKEVQPADFIISLRSFQGGIEYSRFHGICSPAYLILKRLGDGSDDYFRHLFKSDRFIQQLTRNIEGLRDGKMISYKQFSEHLLPTPDPAEQRKIAACLSSVDELLGAEGKMLDALRAHKNGLMQQLFPRPGESRPRLRFPEFRDAEEWKTDRFDQLYAFVRNNALSRDKLNYERGVVKNVHYGDIHTKFSALFDITKERVPFINETEPVPPFDAEDYCTEGDLIFADASEDTNDVGKCIEVVNLNGERLLAGQHTILARRIDDRLIVGFSGYLFRSKRIRAQIEREAQGTKVYGISGTRLANVEVAFPAESAEQQRIAAILGSLDSLAAAASRRRDCLLAHKKGLMQQLFPSPKGV